jgi:hypothetical protein
MKIRKKGPKPSAHRPPLYLIGYRGGTPAPDELTDWFDLEYGGPLALNTVTGAPASWHAKHGPWTAHLVMPFPADQTARMAEQLAWEHKTMGAVAPSVVAPTEMADTILLAARLSRGLTLLTQGTAFDLITQAYLNPSDWQDRTLTIFLTRDHITIVQGETPADTRSWFHTLGLSKFGLDELEFFQPAGLPGAASIDLLLAAAEELLRKGQNQKVGTQLDISSAARAVRFVKHRTATVSGKLVILREIERA